MPAVPENRQTRPWPGAIVTDAETRLSVTVLMLALRRYTHILVTQSDDTIGLGEGVIPAFCAAVGAIWVDVCPATRLKYPGRGLWSAPYRLGGCLPCPGGYLPRAWTMSPIPGLVALTGSVVGVLPGNVSVDAILTDIHASVSTPRCGGPTLNRKYEG